MTNAELDALLAKTAAMPPHLSIIFSEFTDAIAALREQLRLESTLRLQCANDSQMHLARALKAEADNAALRKENARLLQVILSTGIIPFNWKELEADNAALLSLVRIADEVRKQCRICPATVSYDFARARLDGVKE